MTSAADLNALFSAPRPGLRVYELGRITLPSGRVVAADPLISSEGWRVMAKATTGTHRAEALAGPVPSWGDRNAAARLVLSQRRPIRFTTIGQIGVDAGLAGFYPPEMQPAIDAALADNSIFDTPFLNHRPSLNGGSIELNGQVMALCRSGFGDGVYDVSVGYDDGGAPVVILIDFGVEPELP